MNCKFLKELKKIVYDPQSPLLGIVLNSFIWILGNKNTDGWYNYLSDNLCYFEVKANFTNFILEKRHTIHPKQLSVRDQINDYCWNIPCRMRPFTLQGQNNS